LSAKSINARRTPQKKGGSNSRRGISRRDFLATTAAGGAGFWLASPLRAAEPASKNDELHVAIIGTGTQGRVLLENCVKIPGIRFVAVCDIWSYSQRRGSGFLKDYKHEVSAYEDYREMLDKEKALDAVIVATPDWMHAEHSIACLQAGKHVYCEKEMSNSLEQARQMVLAARQTGKLLQIGHQRRSNPRYIMFKEKILDEAKILGRITHINGQWNRSIASTGPLGFPKDYEIDAATLQKYGYENMDCFRNWRWYKKYGAGPIADLGSHQIDVFNWFLGTPPKSVMASGGTDYYKKAEWYDNVMAIYEFPSPQGLIRAFYQVLSTSSSRSYFEVFMGVDGTLQISEDARKCRLYAEGHLVKYENQDHPWKPWVDKKYIVEFEDPAAEKPKETTSEMAALLEIYGPSPKPTQFLLTLTKDPPYHRPHLENFFDAVRGKAKLNCPPEVAYETAVTVLTVNDAVAATKRVDFKPEEFKV